MDFFDRRHFIYNKRLLRLFGLWPHQSLRTKCISLIILTVFCATQIVAKFCATISSRHDLNVVIEDVAPICSDFSSAIKIINVAVQRKKLTKILNRIETDYDLFTKKGEMEIILKYAQTGRKLTIICLVVLTVAIIQLTVVPLKKILSRENGTGNRPMLHHVEYYVDSQKYYYVIIGQTYFVYFVVCLSYAMADTMFMVFVQHACGLFKTLGYRLTHLIDDDVLDDDDFNPPISKDKYFNDISECVIRHQKAIEFAELVDSYYSKTFFLVSGLSMLRMSVTGLKAALSVGDTKQLIQDLAVCNLALVHVFFDCLNGQRLINHSNEVHDNLINCEWYRTSARTRQLILLMSLRSLKPSILLAAGLLSVSLETYSAIVRTSISYYTIIRSFQ